MENNQTKIEFKINVFIYKTCIFKLVTVNKKIKRSKQNVTQVKRN